MIKLFGYQIMVTLAEIGGETRLRGMLPDGRWLDGPIVTRDRVNEVITSTKLIPYAGPEFATLDNLEEFLFEKTPEIYEKEFPGIARTLTPEVVRAMWSRLPK